LPGSPAQACESRRPRARCAAYGEGVEVGEDCSFDACGGDPIGEWNVSSDSVCPEPLRDPDCPEATLEQNVDSTGTVTLAEDGTFTMQVSYSGELVLRVPLSCIDGTSCADGDVPELDLTCAEDGADSCRCVFAVDNQDTEDGVWERADDNILALLEENATDVVVAGEYCVRGDELVIRDQASSKPYTWILRR